MSRHCISTTSKSGAKFEVAIGYDRPLDFVFCTVEGEDRFLYSNLEDENAGTVQQDVRYYEPVLEGLGITLPGHMFAEVENDQANRVGNRVVNYTPEGTVIEEVRS